MTERRTLSQQVAATARAALKNLVEKGRLPWPREYGTEFWSVARELGYFSVAARAEPEPMLPEEVEEFIEETDKIIGGVQDTVADLVVGTKDRVAEMMGSIDAIEDKDHENLFMEEIEQLRRQNLELTAHSEEARKKIEQQTALIEQLKAQVRIDPLTGLYNRRALEVDLKREMARAKRYKFPLALVMCDIDFFKRINDSYGHKIGDKVLEKIARKLRSSLRSSDNVYRYGGEEFLILLPHTNARDAAIFSERMRKTIESYRFTAPKQQIEIQVTLSFGVTEMKTTDGAFTFIARSDKALYQAKTKGRNRVEVLTDDLD